MEVAQRKVPQGANLVDEVHLEPYEPRRSMRRQIWGILEEQNSF